MDREWESRLNDEEYKNWLKVSQALIHTKEALHDFTREVIKKIHSNILAKTASSRCDGTCKTNKGKAPSCASCTNWVTEIKAYKKCLLNWKNTEPTKWHDIPWEIAKCFMNPQGSKNTAAQNTGPEKTDVSGIFNVLANCKEFGNYLKERKQPETVREIRNKVMHSPTMSFSEDEMKRYLNCMITFLEDEAHLKELEACKTKVRIIKSLRDGEFKVCPEVEINCLEGALESHELLFQSGGEIDEVARQFFDALSRLTKNHKDLERRIDGKFTRISDNFEARMTSIDFSYGELKGKVEWMEKRMSEFEKGTKMHTAGATSPTDASNHDKSLYKNSLQCYAQKKKLGIPKYSHETTDLGRFISTVSIADREFKFEEPTASKKEADQRAAEMALRVLTNEASDENKECDRDPPTSETPAALPIMQKEKSVSYKNKLQEIAQERKIVFPSYETKKTASDVFLSEVFFDGVWYTPGTEQACRKKQDAEQKAAEFVLAYLESEEASARESASSPPQSKDDSSLTDNAGCQPLSSPSIGSTIDVANCPDSKKSFISKLNEYAQQQGQGTHAVYKEIDCTSGFRMKVTIRDMTFEGQVQSSKKEAKEVAAKEAWNALNVQAVPPAKSSPSRPDSEDSILLTTPGANGGKVCSPGGLLDARNDVLSSENLHLFSNEDCDTCALEEECSSTANGVGTTDGNSESVDISDGNSSLEMVQPCESDGHKTYRSKLNEYRQSVGSDKVPCYEDISCDPGFRCKVTVLDKTYEGTSPQKSKKEAKEQAARQAYLSLGLDQNFLVESSETSNKNAHVSQADGVQDETFVHDGVLTMAAADSKDKEVAITKKDNEPAQSSNFKGKLLEHANQSKITPMFVTSKSVDESKEFVSKVFFGKRCFKGEKASKRKEAEQNAAKIALEELQGADSRGLAVNCEALLKEYHENIEAKGDLPKYKADADGSEFVAMVTVVKKWKVILDTPRAKKKDAEEGLAQEAIKLLENEKKIVPAAGTTNCRARLNQFCQLQKDAPGPNYDVVSHEQTSFSGDLSFYTVEEYESLSPQLSEGEAIRSAARSACNDLDLA